MCNRIVIIMMVVCATIYLSCHAQVIAIENPESDLQRARIGLVDEFMKRFNGIKKHPDIEPSKNDSLSLNLLWLFDLDQFDIGSSTERDILRSDALEMVRTIQKDSININYSDTDWTAIAHCNGLLYGKSVKFDIFLTVQFRGDDMYKWVINAVTGNCFNIGPKNTTDNLIISPEAHETKFIALQRIFYEQPKNIKLYLSRNVDYDQTSVFAYLIYSGNLKLDYLESLEFVFFQVPGYAFHIQYFDRQSTNSGWLISNFYHFSEIDKDAFNSMIHQKGSGKESACNPNEVDDSINLSGNYETKINIEEWLRKTLCERVNERINQILNYISFLSSDNKDKAAMKFYAKKFESLFTSDANVIIKNLKNGQTKVQKMNDFVDGLIAQKFNNVVIDGITSVILKEGDSDCNDSKYLGRSIMPMSIMGCEKSLCTIFDKMNIPYQTEDTEDGLEIIFKFGDLYISINE